MAHKAILVVHALTFSFRGTQAVTKYKSTINYFEPFLGRQYKDADVQEELKRVCYQTVEMPDGTVGVEVQHLGETMVFSVTQIVGMMLHKIKDVAEAALKTKVRSF